MINKLTILKICLTLLFLAHFAYAGQNDTNTTSAEKTYTKKDVRIVAERSVEVGMEMPKTLVENKDVNNMLEAYSVLKSITSNENRRMQISYLSMPDISDADYKKGLNELLKLLRLPFFSKHPELRIASKHNFNNKTRNEAIGKLEKMKDLQMICLNDKLNAAPDGLTFTGINEYLKNDLARCSEEATLKIKNESNEKEDKLFLSKKQSIVNSYIQKGDAVSMCYDNSIKTQEGVVFCGKAWLESKSLSDFKTKKQKASSIKGESRQGFFNEIAAVDMRNRVQNFCYKVAVCVSKANTAAEEKQCYSNQMEMSNIGNSWAK